MTATKFKQDLDITGNITLSGDITIGGNTTGGNANTDTVTLNADVTSNIVPDADVTYDLGTDVKTWREVFTSKINSKTGDDLDIHSGADIALYPTNHIWIKQQAKLIFEGTTPDDFEAKLQATAVTADRDIILPDASGTIALLETISVGAEGTASGDGSIAYNNTTGVFTYTPPTAAGIGATTLTSFSVGAEGTASGDGSIAYNNTTGVFTYTPPTPAGIGATTLTSFSVGAEGTASGDGSIAYNNTTGVFTYTPPDLSSLTASGDLTILDKIVHSGDTNTAIRFPAADTVTIETNGSEQLRVTSSGYVGIGTISPTEKLQIREDNAAGLGAALAITNVNTSGLTGNKVGIGLSAYTDVAIDSASYRGATIIAETTAAGNVHDLIFSTSTTSAAPAERMRIDDTRVYIGTTDAAPAQNNVGGIVLLASGQLNINVDATFHRIGRSQDGAIVTFYSGGVAQGSLNISGTTFSIVGSHLARWAQFTDNSRPELLKGTVMSNLDQMSVWTNEDNEQLNCVQVSTVEGDPNVAGVFVAWDNSDDGYNDILLAMTGDMVIRIGAGVTVARGDLLMSAGDGTAKPQEDDIVRSKTIAKVTSTYVSQTYEDGSYTVPCVLMAC
jgi:hypothetical protein